MTKIHSGNLSPKIDYSLVSSQRDESSSEVSVSETSELAKNILENHLPKAQNKINSHTVIFSCNSIRDTNCNERLFRSHKTRSNKRIRML